MPKPEIFIIGAPKSGTTAVSAYLSDHPNVCFSQTKEPNYFCFDFPGAQNSHTEAEYLEKEFAHCTSHGGVCAEGSVWYLYSERAVPGILDFNPRAKFLVLLRNPIDAAYSLHSQLLYNRDEDIADFSEAWKAQDARKRGHKVPPLCRQPEFLQYKDVMSYGVQLERLYNHAPHDQIKVTLFDDLTADPRDLYLEILRFLRLPDDGRSQFPSVNTSKRYVSRTLHRITHRPPQWLQLLSTRLKNATGVRRFHVSRFLEQAGDAFNARRHVRPPINREFRARLTDAFRADIERTELLLGRSLKHWLNG